jgi:hypothetical protein
VDALSEQERSRFEVLRGKALGEQGLSDDEANELGRMYARIEDKTYANASMLDLEQREALGGDTEGRDTDIARALEEGDLAEREAAAPERRPEWSDMYGADLEPEPARDLSGRDRSATEPPASDDDETG